MKTLLNIPAHANCKNCGRCCGVIPADEQEIKEIYKWLNLHLEVLPRIGVGKKINCPFRDESMSKCLIYPVRPLMCLMFGVMEGLECPEGNSAKIDGSKLFKNYPLGQISFLNEIDWQAALQGGA